MAITEDRLRQTFSEGGAQEIYQEVKATGDFLGFAHRYAFSKDYYKPAVKCVRNRILNGKMK